MLMRAAEFGVSDYKIGVNIWTGLQIQELTIYRSNTKPKQEKVEN